jgi:hypothetical protein
LLFFLSNIAKNYYLFKPNKALCPVLEKRCGAICATPFFIKSMGNEEIAKVRLEIEGKDAQATFEAITQESKEINAQLREMKKNGEEGSEAWQELRNRQREINAELKDLKHNIDVNDASLNELGAALSYWQTQARKAKEGSEEWIEATAKVQEIKPRIKELTDEMNGLGEVVEKQAEPSGGMWSNLKTSIMGVFTGTALWDLAKEAGQKIFEFGQEVFETTAKFEKYEAVLGNALGTHEKAIKAMDDIKKMAAETPFSVDELTESYVKYVNRGIQPTMEEMVKMGDIAASQGKSFDQLTEAILDAGTGEFERLKEFGIQASKSGDEVVLSFKGMQQTVANTPEAITGALLAFGELQGVQGGMAVISQTLEGRISNLGDNFDSLKLIIGEALMPVFTFLIDLFNDGITKVQQLFTWLGNLGENSSFLGDLWNGLSGIFKTVYEVISSIVDIGVQLIGTVMKVIDNVIGLSGEGKLLEGVLALVGGALKIVGTVAIAALTGIQALADGMNIILNKGKEVANFFGANFKIDTSATWDNLKANAEKNLGAIQNLWKETGETAVKTSAEANKKVTENHTKAEKQMTEEEKREAEKRRKEAEKLAKDKEKATADLNKKIEDWGIKAIADETNRKIAQANLDYKREQDSIKKSIADNATKQKALEAAEKKHTAELTKIEEDARKKKLKAEADTTRKIEDLQVKAIANETQRKIAQANLDYKRKQDEIRNTITDDANKQAALTELERKHTSDVEKIVTDARNRQMAEDKKKADEEKKLRDQKLNEEKIMLDAGFRNEVERARLDLALTREKSQAQWDAKRNLLEQETAYKNAKLAQEAAAEKARIAESISDTDKRAEAIKAIDERLTSQQRQNETQLQNDKKKLQEEANAARKKNNEEFYKA